MRNEYGEYIPVDERPSIFFLFTRVWVVIHGATWLALPFGWIDSGFVDGMILWLQVSLGWTLVYFAVVQGFVYVGLHVWAPLWPEANAQFKHAKRLGYRPFWDSLFWPLHTMNSMEKRSGVKEPDYGGNPPPSDWRTQCLHCGARNSRSVTLPGVACWHCNDGMPEGQEYVLDGGNQENQYPEDEVPLR